MYLFDKNKKETNLKSERFLRKKQRLNFIKKIDGKLKPDSRIVVFLSNSEKDNNVVQCSSHLDTGSIPGKIL